MNASAAARRPSNRRCNRTHACRADLAREAHRALDSLRTNRRGEDPRSPAADRQLRAGRRLRLRALGVERLRHDHLSHRHRTRSCAGRTLRDAAIRPSRRRHSAADQRLAEGRSGSAGDRRGGSLRRRSRRRGAGPLAARPQSPDGWRTAPPLHACAPQGLAHAPQCRAMIGRGAILAVMALGVGATALPQLDDRPPWLVWNASASVPIGLYAVASDHRGPRRRPGCRETARTPCPVPCRRRLSAARRAVAEARGGACRTNGLSHRPQRHCRRDRNGRCPRARRPRPRASCLAGLPRHRARTKSS